MSFLDSLGESINRGACVVLSGLAGQEETLRYVLDPLQTGNPGYNGLGALYADRCGMPPPGRPSSPFAGGQCPNVQYRVQGTYSVDNSPRPPVTGPINRVGYGTFKGFQFGREEGRIILSALFGSPTSPGDTVIDQFGSFGLPGTSNQANSFTTVTSITRIDGQPDDCGNPPPVTPPFVPGSNVVNETVNFITNEGNTLIIPVALAFGYANLNVDGTVNIPVTANFLTYPSFNGEFNLNFNTGNVQPNSQPPGTALPPGCADPSGYVPDPTTPDAPPSLPDELPFPNNPDNPAERERLLRGCIVTSTFTDSKSTIIFQDDNPDIYAPALGYVNFKIRIGGISAWTQDYPVKNLRQFIQCDWEGGAVEVRGTPRYGTVFTVSPVFSRRTFNPTYPPETFE